MTTLKLSQIMAKVPAAKVKILNLSFELQDTLGWVILEGELCVGEDESESIISINIPLMLSDKEILELLSVVKVQRNIRRRK